MFYLCTEDSGSGRKFWELICENLFNGIAKVADIPGVSNDGVGFGNLMQYILNIKDIDNVYIVILDNPVDTNDDEHIFTEFIESLNEKNMPNIKIMPFISFEWMFLSLDFFMDWVYEKDDYFYKLRKEFVKCRQDLVNLNANAELFRYRELESMQFLMQKHPKRKTFEKLCKALLLEITKNTGFEVRDGYDKLGQCWYINCCDYENKQDDDVCGLSSVYPSGRLKLYQILENSGLEDRLSDTGLVISETDKNSILLSGMINNKRKDAINA